MCHLPHAHSTSPPPLRLDLVELCLVQVSPPIGAAHQGCYGIRANDGHGDSPSPWLIDPTEAPWRLCLLLDNLDWQELQCSIWRRDPLVGHTMHQLRPPCQEEQLRPPRHASAYRTIKSEKPLGEQHPSFASIIKLGLFKPEKSSEESMYRLKFEDK